MSISRERFDFGEQVVEAGVRAAQGCLAAGVGVTDTVDLLVGGFRDDTLDQGGMLELLAVALMLIVKEREQAKEHADG